MLQQCYGAISHVTKMCRGTCYFIVMLSLPKFNVNKVYKSFAWNKAHGKRYVNE